MYRILHTARLLPSSIIIRLNSTNKIPIRNLPTIDDEDDDDDDRSKKILSSKDYIFADSKSSRFKEKNARKQKQWFKELEQRKIIPKTPLSSFSKETKTTSEKIQEQNSNNKIIRDTYVTPDGIIHEDNFQINFDTDLDEDEEEKEPDEPIPLAVGGRRYPVWYYAGKLKQLASQNKVQETLDYFYKEMMDKERIAPNLFCYQVVIGICARNGYLTQTFDLYREMKNRGYSTVDSRKMTKIFTLLATACYRASDRFRIEYRTFNALIAAFGKHGQVKMAFQLADEMTEVGFIPNEDTYVSLLIACNSEKKTGFKYAIEIWRRMLAFGIKPTPFHFGLLLNITYNCGLGSLKSMHDLLFPLQSQQFLLDEIDTKDNEKKVHRGPSFLSAIDISNEESSHMISKSNDLIDTNDKNQQQLVSSEIIEYQDSSTSSSSSELTTEWWQDPDDIRKGHLLKDHLSPFSNASILKPNMFYNEPNLVGLRIPRSPSERLMLLGGIPGLLKHMQECNVLPNNIIFNTLLNLIPSLTEYEQVLIHVSNICQVKPNIQFYNALILRRLRRRAKQEALQVLDFMREECLSPDEYTFSALAKGCANRHDAEQLLNEMKDLNLKPNQKILEAMLNNAFYRTNFPLLSFICESYRTYNLAVNKGFLERIEKFLLDIRSKILAMEHANVDTDQYRLLSSSYDRFQKFYNRWLHEVPYSKRFDQKISFLYDKPDLKK
ncbi:unnamed protein product [Rotaria sordida]|uniref:Pentacotripeptide-repeat region of PRORP domain-containing protein n=1 Tax=Rotaria sordida TaxID=392033 RepID=A0A818TT18_9BILA|nr:unnamed protein product [Rotaria sordida]CAF3687983.1 unnamed protein product [Rotaria sordida]